MSSRPSSTAAVRAWRADKLSRGLCYHCGRAPHRRGLKTCVGCAMRKAVLFPSSGSTVHVRAWRERQERLGLCNHCGVEPPRLGLKTCASCAEYRQFKDAAAAEVSR